MESVFQKEWAALGETDENRPRRWQSYIRIGWDEVKAKVLAQDPEFARYMVQSLFAGNVFIFKNAYTKDYLDNLRLACFEWGKRVEQSFHKMLEGTPNFHRIIDAETTKKYKVESIRHVYYFYPWNTDEVGIINPVYDRWRILKVLGGYSHDEYEANTPKDGVVDRFMVAQYPAGSGALETHSDPYKFQRYIMGCKMSTRGVDYKEGGLYFVDCAGKEIDIEDVIEVGDIYISYATVLHGVKAIDPGIGTDWDSMRGRWFLGLYSNQSDVVQERHTCYGVKKDEYDNIALKGATTPSGA